LESTTRTWKPFSACLRISMCIVASKGQEVTISLPVWVVDAAGRHERGVNKAALRSVCRAEIPPVSCASFREIEVRGSAARPWRAHSNQ
jgi:hypothetical protein